MQTDQVSNNAIQFSIETGQTTYNIIIENSLRVMACIIPTEKIIFQKIEWIIPH